MNDYILSCCSTVDITEKQLKALDIQCLAFRFILDGKTYIDDFGQSISYSAFYDAMAKGAATATSQINVSEYIDYFEPFLKAGKDILHVAFSGGLTGTVNSARNAAAILAETYPERTIRIVDSLAASVGYGLLMVKAARLRSSGMGCEELFCWLEENKRKVQQWFFSSTLKYYVRGGRISAAVGAFGSALDICPMMIVDEFGKIPVKEKVRTKKKTVARMLQRMHENAENGTDYAGDCYICHSAALEDAQLLAAQVEREFPKLSGKVEIYNMGTVIGSHAGPGTVGLGYWGKERGGTEK